MARRSGINPVGSVLLSLILLSLLMLAGCDSSPEPDNVWIVFEVQPHGGSLVQSLSCTFRREGDTPNSRVGVTVEWRTEKGAHKVERHPAPKATTTGVYTTTFSAPEGKYLDKTFWVQVTWTDDTGFHTAQSEKAVCIVP